MNNKPKYSIADVIRFLKDSQLAQNWDIRRDAIHYLREYAEKKDELEEQINKETLELNKATILVRILTEELKEKANENE